MDSMELERERGITIASAATHCKWNSDHHVNIVDTPGHVDFTIEVERSLRVLDGAVLVLCAVAGVQSQSFTVDRQMNRYKVPRIAFVNKCRPRGREPGPGPRPAAREARPQPGAAPAPHRTSRRIFEGVIDLVRMKALYFEGEFGDDRRRVKDIPAELVDDSAEAYREEMLDAVSMFSDELLEADARRAPSPRTSSTTRSAPPRSRASSRRSCVGSAYKNKGVQPLLDAVVSLPPQPDRHRERRDRPRRATTRRPASSLESATPRRAPVALAFKLEDGRYGQLTYMRIYQGKLDRDTFITNTRTGKQVQGGATGAHALRRDGGDPGRRRRATSWPSSASTATRVTPSPTASSRSR